MRPHRTGLILAVGMWATLMGLFTAHHRIPFDELAWRMIDDLGQP